MNLNKPVPGVTGTIVSAEDLDEDAASFSAFMGAIGKPRLPVAAPASPADVPSPTSG